MKKPLIAVALLSLSLGITSLNAMNNGGPNVTLDIKSDHKLTGQEKRDVFAATDSVVKFVTEGRARPNQYVPETADGRPGFWYYLDSITIGTEVYRITGIYNEAAYTLEEKADMTKRIDEWLANGN
jgi:hypothetical protein